MKWIAQVLGSIVYTFIFSALMYILMVWPIAWFLDLSGFWKVMVIFVFAGIIQALITTVQVFATMPYVWLLKENIVATILSIGILAVNLVLNAINVWKECVGNGFWMIVLAIIITVLLLEVLIGSFTAMTQCYTGEISR